MSAWGRVAQKHRFHDAPSPPVIYPPLLLLLIVPEVYTIIV